MMRSSVCSIICLCLALSIQGKVGALNSYPSGQLCVSLVSGHTVEELNGRWGTETLIANPELNLYLLYAPEGVDVEQLAIQIMGDPAVSAAQANYHLESPEAVRMMVIGAVGGTWGDYQDQDLTFRIGLDAAHELSRGSGVTVAVLDTGVDPAHQALAGRCSSVGYDFVDEDDAPWEGSNGLDDDGDGLSDEGYGHGTMVAGIVALTAPEATILPIRVLDDEGRGDLFRILQGLVHAELHGADVVNMSFGAPLSIQMLETFIGRAQNSGLVTIAAAGNENREMPPYYPACAPHSIMITALDSLDIKADFADFHERVLVSAPGVGVRSAYPGNEWGLGSGCSFAAPFVAGETALILAVAPWMDQAGIEDVLQSAVDPIYHLPENLPYMDKLGTGRILLPLALSGLVTEVGDPLGHAPLRCRPNPSTGTVRLEIPPGILAASPVRVEILDLAGRVVHRMRAEDAVALWAGVGPSGNRAPAGIYYARISWRTGSSSVPIILLH